MKKTLIIIGLSLMLGITTLAAPQKGWTKTDSEIWQYTNNDGTKATGWLQEGSHWYYLDKDGNMLTGWIEVDGSWYYLNGNGDMHTGWLQDAGKWYYFDSSGIMLVNTTTPDGYHLNDSGEWIESNSSTNVDGRMLPEEQKLFDMLNEQMQQQIGKKLEWDETAYKAGKLAIDRWMGRTLYSTGGYEACLREVGYYGYDVVWVHGSAMTIESFVNETITDWVVRTGMYDSKFTKMAVAYGEKVIYDLPNPYYVVYVLD